MTLTSTYTRHQTLLALASILLLTAACGTKGPRVEFRPNFALNDKPEFSEHYTDEDGNKQKGYHSTVRGKTRDRTYASMDIYLSDKADAKPLQIDFKRHDDAYLAETAIYQEDKFATYISVGKDKDSDYMAGIRMRWNF